jgi:hypothetical protein
VQKDGAPSSRPPIVDALPPQSTRAQQPADSAKILAGMDAIAAQIEASDANAQQRHQEILATLRGPQISVPATQPAPPPADSPPATVPAAPQCVALEVLPAAIRATIQADSELRESLRGTKGETGPAGPAGPSSPPADVDAIVARVKAALPPVRVQIVGPDGKVKQEQSKPLGDPIRLELVPVR